MRFLTHLVFIISEVIQPESAGLPVQLSSPGDRYFQQAEHFFGQNQFDSAMTFYDRAARSFKEQTLWKGYVNAMTGKGYSLIRLRNYGVARAVLDTALSAGKESLGESQEVASACYVYGVLLDFTNNPDRALEMHGQALRIRKALLGTNHVKVAESYNGIGEVYRYTLRDYNKAERNFRLSLDILENLQNVDAKYLYRGYYNLATTNRLKNDFEKALGYGFRAIETLESIKPTDTLSFIRCYGIIANIYNNQALTAKAIAYYRKALTLRVARNEMSPEMANDYKNLAQAFIVKEDFDSALDCVDSALMLLRKSAYYDSSEMANIYLIKGKALRESRRNKEALLNYQKSLAIQQNYSRRNALDISNVYMHLSQAMDGAGNYDSALVYVQKSIALATGFEQESKNGSNPLFETLKQRPQLFEQLAHKGSVLMKLAEMTEDINAFRLALDCFTFSDKLMDLYWKSQDRENSRLHFIGNNYYIYEQALDCIYKLYHLTRDERYKELAFQLMDKSKARLLRQDLEKVRGHARENIPDSLLSEERTIRSRITALQNQLGSLKLDAPSDSVERTLNSEMLTHEKELARWKAKIARRFPNYTSDPQPAPVMSLKALQGKLAEGVLFIEYFLGNETIYVFGSLNGQQHLVRIDSTGLDEKIYRFCGLLSDGLQTKTLEADYEDYVDLAAELYTDLLAPVVRAFAIRTDNRPRQLVIIPDGALSLLPFQALIASRPAGNTVDYKTLDYLVRHFAISYSYDAASLFASNHRPSSRKELLAFGWSDGQQSENSGNLPGTYKELQSIGDIRSGRFIMGKEASKASFVNLAPDYSILHLAVHGEADAHDIYNNYLQFQDEKLFAHELYGFHLNANLTVLSACETGYGKVFNAEGVYSLARGFFFAGSKSLLMTLWRIDDQATAFLMRGFYENIERGEYLTDAIHQSQLDYLLNADQYAAHPSHWAGLVLWGTHKEVGGRNVFSDLPYTGIAVLVFLMALGGLMVLRKRKRHTEKSESASH